MLTMTWPAPVNLCTTRESCGYRAALGQVSMSSFTPPRLRVASSIFAMLVDGAGGLPAAESETPVDLIRTMLSVLRRRLGLETAWLSSFRDDVQVFEVLDGNPEAMGLSRGAGASLAGSYCVRVIDGRLPSVIPDTSVNETTPILPITGELDLGAYVGVPVLGPDGSALGMVCAVSRQASPHLVELDLRIVERVNRSGEVLLTHTQLGGHIALRLSIGNLRTTPAHVERAWQLLREAAEGEMASRER